MRQARHQKGTEIRLTNAHVSALPCSAVDVTHSVTYQLTERASYTVFRMFCVAQSQSWENQMVLSNGRRLKKSCCNQLRRPRWVR
jgi:hypothetical protein